MAAALALLLLLAGGGTAYAQQPGDACGPDYDPTGTWMAIPASGLTASAGDLNFSTSKAGADGCAISDSGRAPFVQIDLPDGIWNIFNVSAKLSVTKPSVVALAQVLVGDADVGAAMRNYLRTASQNTLLPKVFENFALCSKRRLALLATGAATKQETFACDLELPDTAGTVITFLAPRLKVCDVMVCAQRVLFTPQGVPLTRSAALMLAKGGNTGASTAGNPRPGSLAAAGDGLVRVQTTGPEVCSGYSNGKYGTCPAGTQCVSTYKPGACSCGDCSAFTNKKQCNHGDTNIGSRDCCTTCPKQPICAVCEPVCNPEFVSIEVTPGTLPNTAEVYSLLGYQYSSTTSAVNYGNNAQKITVTFTFAEALTATLAYAEEFSYSEKASTSIGIPYLSNGMNVEFTATQKFTTTSTNSGTHTSTISYAIQQEIPALTAQTVTANATAGMITVKVPVTITTKYTCDYTTTQPNTAVITTQGVLNAVESSLQVVYGPSYPLSPPLVLPQADATCSSNPDCAKLGLVTGNCCPDPSGVYKSCCSFCSAKAACAEYAVTNTTMCCPAQTNVRNPCCDM